jgi:hypothetical protein
VGLNLRSLLTSPFSFLFTRSTQEDRVAAYVIREHRRGRTLDDILDDPYVRNRLSETQRARLLERGDIIRSVGEDTIGSARDALARR